MNPDARGRLTLSTLPKHFRQIALWFVITLTVGYTTGLIFVAYTTSLTPKGAEERYRGNQNESATPAVPSTGAASADTAPDRNGGPGDTASVSSGILSDTTSVSSGVLSDTTSVNSGVLSDTTSVNSGILSDTTSVNSGILSDTASTPAARAPESTPSQSAATPPADEPEMKFEKSLPEMLNITHTHILAMTSFLALAAAIFALSSRASSRLKSFLIVEPFVAILTSFAAMWLMRYVHPAFSYLLMASSGSFAICFYVMMGYSFLELVKGRDEG